MTRDPALFVLWHSSVIGLSAVAVVLGWADPLLASGREIALAVMVALYILGVVLSTLRLREFLAVEELWYARHKMDGIYLVGSLLFYAGLLGTVGGIASGLIGFDGSAEGTARLLDGVGLGLSSMFVGVFLHVALMVGARFVANVAESKL
jgi:hypothetical protein